MYTATQYTLLQLLFGWVAILNIKQEAKWQFIKQHKQAIINIGNEKENGHRQPHNYRTGDRVVFKNVWKTKFN